MRQPSPQALRHAARYETRVAPHWDALFTGLLFQEVPEGDRLRVLHLGCRGGRATVDLLRRLGHRGRVIAIDPDPAFVDLARRRAHDEVGRRVFFKVESPESLTFGTGVFDVIVANLAHGPVQQPAAALGEMKRVLAPGGKLVLARPLHGTFVEILDMLREIAMTRGDEALRRGVGHVAAKDPTPAELAAAVRATGFTELEVRHQSYRLTFRTAQQAFADPVLQWVGADRWQALGEQRDDRSELLAEAERRLDTYFAGGPLSLTVEAGIAVATAP